MYAVLYGGTQLYARLAVRALGCTRALGDGRGGRGELGELPPRRRADPLSGFCQGRRLLRARPPAPCSWVHVHPGAHSVTRIGARGVSPSSCAGGDTSPSTHWSCGSTSTGYGPRATPESTRERDSTPPRRRVVIAVTAWRAWHGGVTPRARWRGAVPVATRARVARAGIRPIALARVPAIYGSYLEETVPATNPLLRRWSEWLVAATSRPQRL